MLTTDTEALEAHPAPAPAINTPWKAALTDFATAGSECETTLRAAVKSITRGNNELGKVLGEIKKLAPSTDPWVVP